MEIKTDGTGAARKTQLRAYKRLMGIRGKPSKRGEGKRTVDIKITVRIPAMMTKKDAIREVRTLVNEQCNFTADPGDVRVVRAK